MGFEKFVTGIIGIVLVGVALAKAWRAIMEWRRYRKSENWVPVNGLVTESEVVYEYGSEDNSTHTPSIHYTYQVMGQSYEGSLISFGSAGVKYGNHKKAAKVIAPHPIGSQPLIHYDPDDPSKSVLERKYNLSSAVSGLLFGLGGAGLIYLAYFQ